MIAVVKDPLVEQVADRDPPHSIVEREPVEIALAQPADDRQTAVPALVELGQDRRDGALVITSLGGDGQLIPALLRNPVGHEDPADPAAEPATVRLDDVAEALVR